jgi:hypothetical protein
MGRTAALVPTSHTPETIRGYTIRPAYLAIYVTIIMTRVGYRQVKELMEERGVSVDHATINRWVLKYSPLLKASGTSPSS